MKFASFKEFRQAVANTLEDVVAYLNTDHTKMIRELNVGLSKGVPCTAWGRRGTRGALCQN